MRRSDQGVPHRLQTWQRKEYVVFDGSQELMKQFIEQRAADCPKQSAGPKPSTRTC